MIIFFNTTENTESPNCPDKKKKRKIWKMEKEKNNADHDYSWTIYKDKRLDNFCNDSNFTNDVLFFIIVLFEFLDDLKC